MPLFKNGIDYTEIKQVDPAHRATSLAAMPAVKVAENLHRVLLALRLIILKIR